MEVTITLQPADAKGQTQPDSDWGKPTGGSDCSLYAGLDRWLAAQKPKT
jgi:hypothetical protein